MMTGMFKCRMKKVGEKKMALFFISSFLPDFVTSMYLIHLIKKNAFGENTLKLHKLKGDWIKGFSVFMSLTPGFHESMILWF